MWRDWEETNLAAMGEYINGYAFKPSDWGARGMPIIRIAQITGTSDFDNFYNSPLPEKYRISNGDIIFSWSGTLSVVQWDKRDGWLNQHLFKVLPRSKFHKRFFFHALKNSVEEITKRAHGSTMHHIKRGELVDYTLEIPTDPEEQKAIAEVLDTVDEAIAATQAMLEKQDKIKDGLLQDLLTRCVDASGKLRKEKQKNNATVADVVNLVNHKIAIGKNPNYPYIGLEHIDKKTLYISRFGNALDSVSSNNVFAPDDILFGKLRPNLRKCALAETNGYCSTDILVLRANASVVPLFALYVCSSEAVFNEAIKSTEGTKMPRTSWATIKEVPVYLPDEEEQKRIVGVISAHLKKNRDTENELTKLKKLKAGLMQDLLTGKKRVPTACKEAA